MKNYSYSIYHEKSKNVSFSLSNEKLKNPSNWPKSWKEIETKSYDRFESIKLLEDLNINENIIDVIHRRTSIRNISKEGLSFQKLSTILRNSLGTKQIFRKINDLNMSKRTYPSAGARFPCECYLIINNVKSLEAGLYHFNIKKESLSCLIKDNLSSEVESIFGENFKGAKAILIISTVMNRNYPKYGERGYRFALLEAGHIMQNICLISTTLEVDMTPIGGFVDVKLVRLLDIDEEQELPIYCCAFV